MFSAVLARDVSFLLYDLTNFSGMDFFTFSEDFHQLFNRLPDNQDCDFVTSNQEPK